jgi:hypothetical protein
MNTTTTNTTIPNTNTNTAMTKEKLKIIGYVVIGLLITALLIYWILYSIFNLSGRLSIARFILNLLLIIVVAAFIYKTFHTHLPSGNEKKNSFFTLIINILLYIPCLVSGLFDYAGKTISGQDKAESSYWMMLIFAIGLILAYFLMPNVFNLISTQGGEQLVNRPVYTNTMYNLGSYEDLNGGSDDFNYQYAISCWVFMDASPPNTSIRYNKYTSLLNFGNKPNILYNAKAHKLMITMKQKDLKNITKNKLIDFDEEGNRIVYTNDNFLLQKWNNIIINYNGGTLDIFLNGELVKSSIECVPYITLDNLTIGENEGLNGGMCNVVYFRHALTSNNIYYIYNTLKDKTPPVLNDSNATILTQNVNTTANAI